MTAPDVRGRLQGDPRARRQDRRGRPAAHAHRRGGRRAPRHPPGHRRAAAVRPGQRALRARAWSTSGDLADHVTGVDEVARAGGAVHAGGRRRAHRASPRRTSARMARELAAAPRAPPSTAGSAPRRRRSARSRAGSSTCSTWSPATSTGPGGAMFPLAAAGQSNARPGKRRQAVDGRPVAQPGARAAGGDGRAAGGDARRRDPHAGTRARCARWSRSCGNPCLSHPERRPARRGRRGSSTSWCRSTSTSTRRAGTPTSSCPGRRRSSAPHYDVAFYQLSVRNVANWTPAALPSDVPQEWETLLRLTGIVAGHGPDGGPRGARRRWWPRRPPAGHGVDLALAQDRTGPARLLDLMLRGGPYDLTLADLEAAPHGVDLGPLTPRAAGGAVDGERPRRAGPGGDHRRRAAAGGRCSASRVDDRAGPDRPAAAGLQQLVDAQPRAVGARAEPVHRAGAPGRRDAARARRRRRRRRAVPGRARSRSRWRSPTRSGRAW